MKKTITLEWFKAAGIRALKTFAQTLLGMLVVGSAMQDVDWLRVISVALFAAVASIVTSMAGLPETGSDGVMKLDTTDPDKTIYKLELNSPVESLSTQKVVKFTVDPNTDLSQK